MRNRRQKRKKLHSLLRRRREQWEMIAAPPAEEDNQSFQKFLSTLLWPQAAKKEGSALENQDSLDTKTDPDLEIEPD